MGNAAADLGCPLAAAASAARDLVALEVRGRALLRLAARLVGWYHRVEVHGAELLPRGRPVIFVAKRPRGWAVAEALLLEWSMGAGAPLRHQQAMGALAGPTAWLAGLAGAIPVGQHAALEALRRGESVLVFPGGERELHGPPDTILWRGRRRHARLAALTGTPVVPVVFEGADRRHPWALRLSPRRTLWLPFLPLPVKLTIRFGAPLAPPTTADGAAVAAFSEGVAHATRLLLLPGRRRRRRRLVPSF